MMPPVQHWHLKIVAAVIALLSAALALPIDAMAQDASGASPLAMCFAPTALATKPGELHSVKGDRRFDRPPAETSLASHEAVPAGLTGSIRRVALPPGKKLLALTFDLCELPGEVAGYDGAIIDYLRQSKVKATFFAGGKWMRSHRDRTWQLMADPLFEVGNHAEAHRNLRLLDGAALTSEVLGPQRAYETLRSELASSQCLANHPASANHIARRISLFRFPFGACNAASLDTVNQAGLLAVQWDVSTGDPSPGTSASAIVSQVLRTAKPGSIIIAHANGRGQHTAEAMPILIPKLRALGFEFVTVSELLAAGRPVVTPTCYDSRPGDTDRYDTFFKRAPAAPAAVTARAPRTTPPNAPAQ